MTGPPELSTFASLHAVWFATAALCTAWLYFRPSPMRALLVVILMHGLAFLAYYGNLPRAYAVGVSNDRALMLGMAMAVADGGSPFNHVQVEFTYLEPLWTFAVAALSGFSMSRVPFVYDHMALLALTLTGLGFFWAWSAAVGSEDAEAARWRGVLVAAGALGLSSLALADNPRILPFWVGNFVFKPNHAMAFGLVGLLSRWQPADRSWLQLGLIQGLLIWVFILDWAYLAPAFFLAALCGRDRGTGLKRAFRGTLLGILLGVPYLLHALRDYNPLAEGEVPEIWLDHMGDLLVSPILWSWDLIPLILLLGVGIVFAIRRSPAENGALGFLLSGPLVAVCYVLGLQIGLAPEPDEGLYYWRLVASVGAGYGLWCLAAARPAGSNSRFALAFGLILAFSFPAYFDPARDDRFFSSSLEPLPPPVLQTAQWLRDNTTVESVIVSLEGITLGGLTGRRFLMVRPSQTRDRNERERAERDIVTSLDEEAVRRAAARYRVTHVVRDNRLLEKYGDEARRLGNRPWFEPAQINSFASILILKPN